MASNNWICESSEEREFVERVCAELVRNRVAFTVKPYVVHYYAADRDVQKWQIAVQEKDVNVLNEMMERVA